MKVNLTESVTEVDFLNEAFAKLAPEAKAKIDEAVGNYRALGLTEREARFAAMRESEILNPLGAWAALPSSEKD